MGKWWYIKFVTEKISLDYYGELLDGKPHGKGTIKWSNGYVYEGEVIDVKGQCTRHGNGEMTWPSSEKYPKGMKYIGEWKNDKQEGVGKMIWHGIAEVVGDFKDGLPNGECEQIFTNGIKYVGQFKEGRREGKGTLTVPGGENYIGEWKNNVQHGYGKMIYADGVEYEGQFENGDRNGKGTLKLTNGGEYTGDFKDNDYHGYGTLKVSNGDTIIGEWRNTKLHGQATLISPEGKSKEVVWDEKNKDYIEIDKGNVN